ncbi:glycoside hydrolase family 32 protein [Confluentibacter flavum]|uniref:Glycosyl hydrolase family 32 n=1 Tax=Confluentibacter flavum TaxID=1909700 RepID=A0A2N3HKA8_9FLAO|nr:glycoside hydrolase family 32 protein [Confluentibacter flavum]PKQ45363.1 hypothetical protein CSW08_08310 [Confluentibacter flavum]
MKQMFRNISMSLIAFFMLGYSNIAWGQYDEIYRPQYHFSPSKGWIGDPDGLIHYDGLYHLFWWGHAVSKDMVYWEELEYPMVGDPGDFSYFSGSVVVDKNNDAEFGKNSLLAFYTRHFPGDSLPETQAISVSKDGLKFEYYKKNPVLDINEIFFRDPQVFWHEKTKKWVMAVSLPNKQIVQFYGSKNLKDWSFLSNFQGHGVQNSFWECPDIFEVPVLGKKDETHWVLFIGRGPNRVQYFVGDFDGSKFTPHSNIVSYLDKGEGMNAEVFEDFEDIITPKTRSGFLGNMYLDSKNQKDKNIIWESKPFIITKPAINFLISGSDSIDKQSIQLIKDNEVLKEAVGKGDSIFRWKGWDVTKWLGAQVRIRMVNKESSNSIDIALDHIQFSDELQNTNLEHGLWLDYGNDFYAARTWRDYDGKSNRKVMLGWLGNWEYSRTVPTTWGKGFESIPREIMLKESNEGFRLIQNPIDELKKLRGNSFELDITTIDGILDFPKISEFQNTYEMHASFKFDGNAKLEIKLQKGHGRSLILLYDSNTSLFKIDRNNTTDASSEKFLEKFKSIMQAPVNMDNGILNLKVFVDRSSVEIFTQDGEKVFSVLTFPGQDQTEVSMTSEGEKVTITKLKVWKLNSIWDKNRNN